MKVLVTGSAGFIGKNLLERFANNNDYEVFALDIKTEYPLHLVHAKNIHFFHGDVVHNKDLLDIGFDWIVHLAALAGVRDSADKTNEFVHCNIAVTNFLMDAARRMSPPAKFVYASSSSVYGDDAPLPLDDNVPFGPAKSMYGLTKQVDEMLAEFYEREHNLQCVGLRFFTVYGPYGRENMAIGKFAKCLLENKPIHIFGDGEQTRDYTYVGDVVDAIIASCQSDVSGVFNVGPGTAHSVNELAQLILKAFGQSEYKGGIVHEPRNPCDVQDTLANTDKIYQQLRVRPKVSLEQGLAMYAQWLLKEHENFFI